MSHGYGRHGEASQSVCDADCRLVNGCGGRVTCAKCEKPVCGCETDENGNCPECQAEIAKHTCQGCGEYDPSRELDADGFCPSCAKDLESVPTVAVG